MRKASTLPTCPLTLMRASLVLSFPFTFQGALKKSLPHLLVYKMAVLVRKGSNFHDDYSCRTPFIAKVARTVGAWCIRAEGQFSMPIYFLECGFSTVPQCIEAKLAGRCHSLIKLHFVRRVTFVHLSMHRRRVQKRAQ